MPTRRKITDEERRARLVARHHLGYGAVDVLHAVRSLTVLHSSDPATPYLSLRARIAGFERGALEEALLVDRSLWRLHAMRRTLFVVPADEGVVFLAGATRSVAGQERKRLLGWLTDGRTPAAAEELLARLERAIEEALPAGAERSTQELAAAIPEMKTEVTLGSGKWSARSAVGTRVLPLMAMDGIVVRTRPGGSWRSSQYRWAATRHWFPNEQPFIDEETARAEIVRRYLRAHGPATLDDVRWWTGWTVGATRRAVSALDLETVELEDGAAALVLEDDLDTPLPPDPTSITLLPALDSTPMGWRGRGWYIGPHQPHLFDGSGNVGATIWSGGRIVGLWGQRGDGSVVVRVLEETGGEVGARIAHEAAAVEEWLGGDIVKPRFPTPAEREMAM